MAPHQYGAESTRSLNKTAGPRIGAVLGVPARTRHDAVLATLVFSAMVLMTTRVMSVVVAVPMFSVPAA